MIVSELYLGSSQILEIYKGYELIYTAQSGFMKPWELLIETEVFGDAKANPSAPMNADGVIPIVVDCNLLSPASATPSVEGGMELNADADLYVYLVAPFVAEQVMTTEYETDAVTVQAISAEGEIGTAFSMETEANAGSAISMESEQAVAFVTDVTFNAPESRLLDAIGEVKIEVDATIVALEFTRFQDGVLYISTAYSATLNDGILEVS